MAKPDTITAILGGAGQRATEREARRFEQAVKRRRRQARARKRVRHAEQRAALQTLASDVIPRLERRASTLRSRTATPFSSTLSLTGPTDIEERRKLARAERQLTQARGRAKSIEAKISQRRGRRAEPVTPLEVGLAVAGALPPVKAAEGVGLLARAFGVGGKTAEATKAGETVAAKTVAKGAGSAAARKAGTSAAARGAETAAERSAGKRALLALKNRPKPYTAARKGIGAGGRKAATRLGKTRPVQKVASTSAGKAARRAAVKASESKTAAVAGHGLRAATFPARAVVKRPFTTPIVAQAPVALATGDPGSIKKAFEGQGVVAQASNAIGEKVASAVPGEFAGNVVRDAFALPTTALPSVYLPVAGLVEKARGNPERFDALWKDYKDHGLVPAVLSGDWEQAGQAIKEHPLFSAAEASGTYALAGRGAGGILRRAPSEAVRKTAGTKRKPLTVYGKGKGAVTVPRSYSKNILTKTAQRAREERLRRKGKDPDRASKKKAEVILTGQRGEIPVLEGHRTIPINLIHRFMDQRENARRSARDETIAAHQKARPKFHDGVVSEIVQRSVRSPETFHKDLLSRLDELKAAERNGNLTSAELQLNKYLQESIEKALTERRPEVIADLFRAADDFIAQHGGLVKDLIDRGLLDPKQAERAAVIPYAQRHMGARRGRSKQTQREIDDLKAKRAASRNKAEKASLQGQIQGLRNKKELVDGEGNYLRTEDIKAHMKENGVGEPGFLTHAPGVSGKGSFYRAASRRPGAYTKRRMGESFRRGAFESGYDALTGQLAKARTDADAARTLDAFAKQYGIGAQGKRGKFFASYGEGKTFAEEVNSNPQLAARLGIPEGLEVVPMRLDRPGARRQEGEAIERHATPEGLGVLDPTVLEAGTVPKRVLEIAEDAFKPGPGKVVLVPKILRDEFLSHQTPMSAAGRSVQSLNQGFKATVLPLPGTKWQLGNVFELQMRQIMNGILPYPLTYLDPRYHVGRSSIKAAREIDPEKARGFEAMTTGTAFTGEKLLQVHRDSNALAQGFERLKATPAIGHLIRGYSRWVDLMYNLNGKLEAVGTTAGLGKLELQQLREQGKSQLAVLRGSDRAIKDLAEGNLNTPAQLRYAKGLEDMYGRWKANRPGVRKVLLNFAPFWMWTRSATRFVALTLPVHHPIKLGILAAATEMTEPERQRLGLDILADRALPIRLQGSLPTPSGGIIPTNYYSSFGVWADYPDNAARALLPQFSNPLGVMQGLDWKGDKLRNEDGTELRPEQKIGVAAYSMLEAVLPGLAVARRLQEGGGSSAATSTALSPKTISTSSSRPGDFGDALKKVFVPQPLDPGLVEYLRDRSHSQEITVPVKGVTTDDVEGKFGIAPATSAADLEERFGIKSTSGPSLEEQFGLK